MTDDKNLSIYDMNNGITYIGVNSNKLFNDGFILNNVTQHVTSELYKNKYSSASVLDTICLIHNEHLRIGAYLKMTKIYSNNISASLDLDSIVDKSK